MRFNVIKNSRFNLAFVRHRIAIIQHVGGLVLLVHEVRGHGGGQDCVTNFCSFGNRDRMKAATSSPPRTISASRATCGPVGIMLFRFKINSR